MPKKEEYLDYFDDEELENWEEEIDALWEDDYGEFCDLTDEDNLHELQSTEIYHYVIDGTRINQFYFF